MVLQAARLGGSFGEVVVNPSSGTRVDRQGPCSRERGRV